MNGKGVAESTASVSAPGKIASENTDPSFFLFFT